MSLLVARFLNGRVPFLLLSLDSAPVEKVWQWFAVQTVLGLAENDAVFRLQNLISLLIQLALGSGLPTWINLKIVNRGSLWRSVAFICVSDGDLCGRLGLASDCFDSDVAIIYFKPSLLELFGCLDILLVLSIKLNSRSHLICCGFHAELRAPLQPFCLFNLSQLSFELHLAL